MKKIIYIFIIGFGLVAVSCQKQDITPVNDNMEIPTWDDANSRTGEEGMSEGTGEDPGEGSGGVDITDPNKPTEGSGKGKGNS